MLDVDNQVIGKKKNSSPQTLGKKSMLNTHTQVHIHAYTDVNNLSIEKHSQTKQNISSELIELRKET